jgi:hypothetical protein
MRRDDGSQTVPLLHWEEGLGEEGARGRCRAYLLSLALSSHVEERG